jgi:hypothetical protein
MRGVADRRSEGRSPARTGSFGQPQVAARQRIIAERGDGFQAHVSRALDGPFIVLFEQDGADEAGDGGFVGEDADDVGAPLDLADQPLDGVGGA